MRRAAVQAFRAARRPGLRKLVRSRSNNFTPNHHNALTYRSIWTRKERSIAPLAASMQLRPLSIAVASSLVAGGAWLFATRSNSTQALDSVSNPVSHVRSSYVETKKGYAGSYYSLEKAAESTRKALFVGPEELYSATISGSGPLSKDTDDAGRKVLEMMTPEQVGRKLRRNEESYIVGRGNGVVRYDTAQLPSNDPIEDDHAEKIVEVPQSIAATEDGTASSDWMFWGVFDGHSGWTTSAKLRQVLISFVARELTETYQSALTDPTLTFPSSSAIDAAIKKGFVKLDHEIVHDAASHVLKVQSKRVAAEVLAPALSGSCALLSFYDTRSHELRVACTGDSRAVLGRRAASGKWTATALSEDQTGATASEMARLRREHPGEEYVTQNGRILGGLEPSRAFGDSLYKWSLETQERIKKSYFGRSPSPRCKTPPYVTAEPVVTTTKVQPENGDFVVMATDGLWEMLTNEEVVGLVGQWLEAQEKGVGVAANRSQGWLTSWFSGEKGLPVEASEKQDGKGGGQRAPIRQQQWGVQGKADARFVVEDKNAATHLIRNALGGKDRDMVCALLTLPSPYSRRYRDDLTVEVIFFGNKGEGSGNVERNKEASAAFSEAFKAKL
ncbi:pyruvate dehydrogenase phosphatase [Viridothelium virens]|uniref:Pyruvate dehydrogenase phosphatase n=1 Tax=Viridothelium virens TaxID=1048519 RepID=A0A6A6HAR6_VIRVR|nr:pyruvate dehydrogenase phosphatase [Viridothelium virens]